MEDTECVESIQPTGGIAEKTEETISTDAYILRQMQDHPDRPASFPEYMLYLIPEKKVGFLIDKECSLLRVIYTDGEVDLMQNLARLPADELREQAEKLTNLAPAGINFIQPVGKKELPLGMVIDIISLKMHRAEVHRLENSLYKIVESYGADAHREALMNL